MRDRIVLFNPPGISAVPMIRDFYCSFSSKSGYYWPPQDLLSLSGILRDNFDLTAIDAVADNLSNKTCSEAIKRVNPRAVIFATGMASLPEDLRFMQALKQELNTKLVASSSIFRFNAKQALLNYPFLDAFITDFTDRGILAYLKGESSSIGAEQKEEGEFSIGLPLYKQFIRKRNRLPLFGDSPFAITFTSFGCKFNCAFCAVSSMKIKFRAVKEVEADLDCIRKLGIKNIFFTDPLFTADKERAIELSGRIKKFNINWVCNAHPSTICDEEMLEAMKDSGCLAVMIGVESGDDMMLKKCRKGTDTAQIKKVFSLCRKKKIKTLAYFIIGLPGETRDSAEKTINFSRLIDCDYASFGYFSPEFGTEFGRDMDLGLENSTDPSLPPVFSGNGLSRREIIGLFRSAYRRFYLRPGYVLRRFLEIRSFGDLCLLIKQGRGILKRNIL